MSRIVGIREQTWICTTRIGIFETKNYDLGGSNKKTIIGQGTT
jgi:hypothetical protein